MDHDITADDLPQFRLRARRSRAEVDRVLFAMESNGSKSEAETVRGYLDAVETMGDVGPALRQMGAGMLLIQKAIERETTRANEAERRFEALIDKQGEVIKEATEAFDKALVVEERRLKVEEAKITSEREARRGQMELKRAVAEEAARTERFQIQNRRLVWVAAFGLLSAIATGSTWVGVLVERSTTPPTHQSSPEDPAP